MTHLHFNKQANAHLHLVALLLSVGVGAAGCSLAEAEPRSQVGVLGDERPIAVRSIEVRRRDVHETIDYVGTIRYRREVKVGARIAGTLREILVVEGDIVGGDALLATIETPELQDRLRGAAAEIHRLAAQCDQACRAARADRSLAEQDVLPRLRAAASDANCEALRQGVNAARSRRAEVRTSLGFTEVRASNPGVVLDLMVEPGEVVGPGRPLLLQGTGPKEIEVQVSDEDLLRGVEIGTNTLIRAAGSDRYFRAAVARVAPIATGPGRHVAVRIALPPELGLLPPGVAVDVRFIVAEERGASPVPLRALHRTASGGDAIYVLYQGRASVRPLSRGITERGWITVHPPLEEGTIVVTSNLGMVRDGAYLLAIPERDDGARP